MNEKRIAKSGLFVAAIALWFGFVGCAIYVTLHFIAKFW